MSIRAVCLFVAALLTIASARADEIKELAFGVIATDSSQAIRQRYDPLFRDLERSIGIPVKFFYTSDYAGMIQAMRFGKVQIARFGNKSAAEVVDRADGEVAFRGVDLDGTMGYHSVLIVHRDSPLTSVEDMLREGKTLAFGAGDPNSTSGTVVPGYYVFAKNGVDPKKLLRRVGSANHDTNTPAVPVGQLHPRPNNNVAPQRIA